MGSISTLNECRERRKTHHSATECRLATEVIFVELDCFRKVMVMEKKKEISKCEDKHFHSQDVIATSAAQHSREAQSENFDFL